MLFQYEGMKICLIVTLLRLFLSLRTQVHGFFVQPTHWDATITELGKDWCVLDLRKKYKFKFTDLNLADYQEALTSNYFHRAKGRAHFVIRIHRGLLIIKQYNPDSFDSHETYPKSVHKIPNYYPYFPQVRSDLLWQVQPSDLHRPELVVLLSFVLFQGDKITIRSNRTYEPYFQRPPDWDLSYFFRYHENYYLVMGLAEKNVLDSGDSQEPLFLMRLKRPLKKTRGFRQSFMAIRLVPRKISASKLSTFLSKSKELTISCGGIETATYSLDFLNQVFDGISRQCSVKSIQVQDSANFNANNDTRRTSRSHDANAKPFPQLKTEITELWMIKNLTRLMIYYLDEPLKVKMAVVGTKDHSVFRCELRSIYLANCFKIASDMSTYWGIDKHTGLMMALKSNSSQDFPISYLPLYECEQFKTCADCIMLGGYIGSIPGIDEDSRCFWDGENCFRRNSVDEEELNGLCFEILSCSCSKSSNSSWKYMIEIDYSIKPWLNDRAELLISRKSYPVERSGSSLIAFAPHLAQDVILKISRPTGRSMVAQQQVGKKMSRHELIIYVVAVCVVLALILLLYFCFRKLKRPEKLATNHNATVHVDEFFSPFDIKISRSSSDPTKVTLLRVGPTAKFKIIPETKLSTSSSLNVSSNSSTVTINSDDNTPRLLTSVEKVSRGTVEDRFKSRVSKVPRKKTEKREKHLKRSKVVTSPIQKDNRKVEKPQPERKQSLRSFPPSATKFVPEEIKRPTISPGSSYSKLEVDKVKSLVKTEKDLQILLSQGSRRSSRSRKPIKLPKLISADKIKPPRPKTSPIKPVKPGLETRKKLAPKLPTLKSGKSLSKVASKRQDPKDLKLSQMKGKSSTEGDSKISPPKDTGPIAVAGCMGKKIVAAKNIDPSSKIAMGMSGYFDPNGETASLLVLPKTKVEPKKEVVLPLIKSEPKTTLKQLDPPSSASKLAPQPEVSTPSFMEPEKKDPKNSESSISLTSVGRHRVKLAIKIKTVQSSVKESENASRPDATGPSAVISTPQESESKASSSKASETKKSDFSELQTPK